MFVGEASSVHLGTPMACLWEAPMACLWELQWRGCGSSNGMAVGAPMAWLWELRWRGYNR